MNIEKVKGYHCPVEAAMDVVGGKYKALIVYELILTLAPTENC